MKALLTQKEMDAVEDALFCHVDAPRLKYDMKYRRSAWKKLCKNAGD